MNVKLDVPVVDVLALYFYVTHSMFPLALPTTPALICLLFNEEVVKDLCSDDVIKVVNGLMTFEFHS